MKENKKSPAKAEEKELNQANYSSLDELATAILEKSEERLKVKQRLQELLCSAQFKDKLIFDGACKQIAEAFKMTPREVTATWQALHGGAEDGEQTEEKILLPCEYDIEPCSEEVKPYDLLEDLKNELKKYIVFKEYDIEDAQALTCALWALASWFVHSFKYCPYLIITAPTPRCGKSQLLKALGRLSRREFSASNMSSSILFRGIEKYQQPTVFIDEVDTFLKYDAELRGLINAGIEKGDALAWRSKPLPSGDYDIDHFDTFSFKALSGISAENISSTISDRSIKIKLARKFSFEERPKVRDQSSDHWTAIQRRCARVAVDCMEWVTAYIFNDKPSIEDDRALDKWQPLITIADMADCMAKKDGKTCDFGQKARRIAELLSKEDADSYFGIELLANIRELLREDEARDSGEESEGISDEMADFIPTKILLNRLVSNEEWRWSTYGKSEKPLSGNSLSGLLKDFNLKSEKAKKNDIDGKRPRGYQKKAFEEAFKRYLPKEEVKALSD